MQPFEKNSLLRRRLGRTDLDVTELSVGTWATGGAVSHNGQAYGWADTQDELAMEALDVAFEGGVNFVDTAPGYGFGRAEELLGHVLRRHPSVRVMTKAGRDFGPQGWANDFRLSNLLRSCEASLKRLGRDFVDVLLLKDPAVAEVKRDQAISAALELKRRGFARFIGFSTHSPGVALRLIATGAFDVVAVEHHVLNQRSRQIVGLAAEHDVGLIGVSPLYFGVLTGKAPEEFSTDDWRARWFAAFAPDVLADIHRSLDRMRELSCASERSLAELALLFAIGEPGFASVLVGARTPKQARENLAFAARPPLEPALRRELIDLELDALKGLGFGRLARPKAVVLAGASSVAPALVT